MGAVTATTSSGARSLCPRRVELETETERHGQREVKERATKESRTRSLSATHVARKLRRTKAAPGRAVLRPGPRSRAVFILFCLVALPPSPPSTSLPSNALCVPAWQPLVPGDVLVMEMHVTAFKKKFGICKVARAACLVTPGNVWIKCASRAWADVGQGLRGRQGGGRGGLHLRPRQGRQDPRLSGRCAGCSCCSCSLRASWRRPRHGRQCVAEVAAVVAVAAAAAVDSVSSEPHVTPCYAALAHLTAPSSAARLVPWSTIPSMTMTFVPCEDQRGPQGQGSLRPSRCVCQPESQSLTVRG